MKTLTLVLSILALLGAGASTYFYVNIGNTKQVLTQQRDEQTKRADGLDTDLTKTKGDLDNTRKDLAKKDSELGDTKKQLQNEKNRAAKLTNDLNAANKKYTEVAKSEAELKGQVVKLREEIVAIRLAVGGGSEEDKVKLAEADRRIKELEGQINSGDIGKSGSAQGGRGVLTRLANTAVASVGSDNAFVILDVGNKQGAAIGQLYAIKRDGNEIARARVSAVRDELTIAQVEPKSIKGDLTKGDVASIIIAATPAAPTEAAKAPAAANKK